MNGSSQNPHRKAFKSGIALFLTFAAGYVDIVGVLTVYQMFTAHMTGTTVHLGEQIIQRNWKAAAIAATIVAAFIVGSVIGRVVIEVGARKRFRRVASIALFLELLLLAAAAWWGSRLLPTHQAASQPTGLICEILSLFAGAMGLQTATLTRIGPLTVHTTFVTGMLNKLAQLITRWLFLSYDVRRSPSNTRARLLEALSNVRWESALMVGVWVCYLGGAVCGTWAGLQWQFDALYLPCLLLLLAIVADQILPLSLEEEKQQSD
ncbi:MAG TPA: YoaK family protein [Terriglobales bacterium]